MLYFWEKSPECARGDLLNNCICIIQRGSGSNVLLSLGLILWAFIKCTYLHNNVDKIIKYKKICQIRRKKNVNRISDANIYNETDQKHSDWLAFNNLVMILLCLDLYGFSTQNSDRKNPFLVHLTCCQTDNFRIFSLQRNILISGYSLLKNSENFSRFKNEIWA